MRVPAIICTSADGFSNLCASVVLALSVLRLGKAMFKDQSRLLVLAACLIAGCAAAEPVTIRGVDPKLASRYSFVHGAFACLSGGKELSADRVNDNYCDCPDGSDEPGDHRPRPFASSSTHLRPATESTAAARG